MQIGLVSGGFKPYHKGHHFLVEKAAAENDVVKIITSVKSRDDLNGEAMRQVWADVIMPAMPLPNVELEISSSPVGKTFEYLDNLEAGLIPVGTVFNIYAGRADLAKRFRDEYMYQKYPKSMAANAIIRTPITRGKDSPKCSGESMRECMGNIEKFSDGLPCFLKPKASLIIQLLI
jgi:hypothetical protein